MSSPLVVVLHHGTTRWRAEQIVRSGPDPLFREAGAGQGQRADGFSAAVPGTPGYWVGTPEQYARGKAHNFPGEGGPVILEVEVPDWIVDLVRADPMLGPGARSGDIRFEPGVGLEGLLREWAAITKRIVPV